MKIEKLGFGQKVENKGTTAAGKLTAEEFNRIPAKIDEIIDAVEPMGQSVEQNTQDITGLKEAVELALKKGELEGVQIDDLDDLMAYLRLNFKQAAEAGETRFRIVNELPSTSITMQTGGRCEVAFSFVSQQYDGVAWVTIPEWGSYSVQVKKASDTVFTTAVSGSAQQGSVVRLDLSEFFQTGDWSVKVEVTGSDTGQKATLMYAVTVTSLSLMADNFEWWTAKTGDFTVPFMITGQINKVLHITVTGADGYERNYDENIGNATYTQTPKVVTITKPEASGVYHIKAYLSNTTGSVQTRALEYDVMCVSEGEQTKLMVVNNVAATATNYAENTLLEYAIYDCGGAYSSLQIKASYAGRAFSDTGLMNRIAAGARNTYTLPLELDNIAGDYFDITVEMGDGDGALTQDRTFSVDNRMSYSSVAGAVFAMDVKNRSNAQANRNMIVNSVTGDEIAAAWHGVNWGNDGWQADGQGYRTLRMMSGRSVEIDYSPFAVECSQTGKTIELDFCVSNVTDFSKPVITIDDGTEDDGFTGLRIYPDNILVHSSIKKDDSHQSLHIFEGERTRLTLTIVPNLYGVSGFNLCILYINGRKNREFEYSASDYWRHNGKIHIGAETADTDVYALRVYDFGLSAPEVQRNNINLMPTTEMKAKETADNDILDDAGNISFEKTVAKYNCLVYDQPFVSMADKTERDGTLEWFDHDHPENNVRITNVHLKGQGTTSMKYWTWNLGFTLKKTKVNGVVQTSVVTWVNQEGQPTANNKWAMNSEQAAGNKFVAKKNYASSMQSHKIGAVNAYTDLVREVGTANAAMQTDEKVRVSVFEMPCFGFEKSKDDEGNDVYTFRGLYTFGSAKGDKATFGMDADKNENLLALEGADNSPLLALFRVPWKSGSQYIAHNADEEAWQYNGANSFDDGEGSPDRIEKFIPAYNFVYECSPRLRPVAKTLAELNAEKDKYANIDYEVWCSISGAEYGNVYYFERGAGGFLASDTGSGQINLVEQLVGKGYQVSGKDSLGNDIKVPLTQSLLTGKTADELNVLFIEARTDKFRQEVSQYWNVDDTLLFMCNVEHDAGTDERAKNTYPYALGLDGDGKWRWYEDDTDTRRDTTNRGLPEKTYSVEVHDYETNDYTPVWNDRILNYSDTVVAGTTPVWNGETNNLFNLFELAFPDEKAAMMRRMLDAMVSLSDSKKPTTLEKLYDFQHKYFFSQAQEYFPAVAYNEDARISYEEGTIAYNEGRYSNDTHPITQSLGDHYLAERRWITRRLVYMMSKYGYGLFAENGGDTIVFRASGNIIRYELTPAIDMYPTMGNGTTPVKGARTKAGEVCIIDIDLGGSADQQNTVYGVSWLLDIGDWHDKPVQGTMTVNGKMLNRLKLGDESDDITIAVSQLNVGDCVNVRVIDLRRIATLRGELNLAVCSHLRELYASGTQLTNILLPAGGGLEKIEYPATEQYIVLKNFVLLENSAVNYVDCAGNVTTFQVQECPAMNPFAMLVDIMKAQEAAGSEALRYVRCVDFDETFDSGGTLDYVAKLADTERYSGLNADGVATADTRVPVLEGRITVNGYAYEDSVRALETVFDPTKLEIIVKGYWVRFADPEVLRVLLEKYDTDKDGGLTQMEVGAITNVKGLFSNNKVVETFDELSQLKNVKEIDGTFTSSSIKSVDLSNIEAIKNSAFTDCEALEMAVSCPNLITMPGQVFARSGITEVLDLGNVTELTESRGTGWETGVFQDCKNLKRVVLPETLSKIGMKSFSGCTRLAQINFPSNITVIGDRAFNSCTALQIAVVLENCTEMGINVFTGSGVTEIYAPRLKKTQGNYNNYHYNSGTFAGYKESVVVYKKIYLRDITEIADGSFIYSRGFETLIIDNPTPPNLLGTNIFMYSLQLPYIYVPDSSVEAYKTATNWSNFADRIKPLSEYVEETE